MSGPTREDIRKLFRDAEIKPILEVVQIVRRRKPVSIELHDGRVVRYLWDSTMRAWQQTI